MKTIVKLLRKPIAASILAIAVGFLIAAIVLAIAGYAPGPSFAALFNGMIGKPKYISNVVIKATPLILTGTAVAFAFKTGLFNIGAEGQYVTGTICAAIVGISCDFPPVLQVPLVILAGTLGGAACVALVGWLKAKFGINEVITSIMLNWISLYACNFVVNVPAFHQPESTSTYAVNPSSYTMILPKWKLSEEGLATLKGTPWLYEVLVKTDVNVGILIAVACAILIAVLLKRTKMGYEMRAVGLNREAAQFAGINVNRNIVTCMLISGALCGLAGALAVTGLEPHNISTLAAFENNGFNGLSVAFIAGSSPIGCIFAGFLFSGLIYGGQSVQQVMGAPSDIINIMIGTIVFLMALSQVVPMVADWLERREKGVANA